MLERKGQQLSYPVDQPSINALRVVVTKGPGSKTKTQSVSVPTTPTNISVPAAYAGTVILEANGIQYEIPFL